MEVFRIHAFKSFIPYRTWMLRRIFEVCDISKTYVLKEEGMEGRNLMRFRFDFTEQDYLDFNMFAIESLRFYQRQKKVFHVVFTALPIATWLVLWLMEGRGSMNVEDKIALVVMGIISLLFYFYFPKFYYMLNFKNAKKILFKEGRSNLFGRTTIEFGEEKIVHITEYEESAIRYEKITKIMESDQAVYLFTAPTMALILPRRAFENRDEEAVFMDFIKRKTGLGAIPHNSTK